MKKYSLPFISITALALAGCAREQSLEEDGIKMVIEAVMAENNTKTIIQDGTTSVLWEAGDEIKVFFDGTGGRFANQYTEPSATARFSGTLNVVFASNEGFSDATPLWGLYPYRTDATADNASVTTTLPASQIGRADSFAKNTLITLGKSTSLSMGFYNVCGGIRFSLTQEGIKEVVFQGLNDENIAGKVRLAFEDGLPAVQEVIEGEKTITLTAPGNATFETGCWYYIVALPGTLSNGFRMTFNSATQYATLESSGSKTVKRGIFGSLANADEGLVFEYKEDSGVEDGNIVFADPAAKYACVTKFDTNGDGEVSIEEAEAATSFNGLFTDWKGVTSFEEINYFKNVHSLSGVFNGCTKLISLTVPENITNLGNSAFRDCSSLTSIILPSGITSIGNYTFYGCSSLTSILLPPGISSIGDYAFYGCSSLSLVDIPSNVITLGSHSFRECSSLISIDLPSGIEEIKNSTFSGCSSLTQIIIPDSVTSIGTDVFSSCENLTTVHLSSGITSIPNGCFKDCIALTSVSIPNSITSIGSSAFYNVMMWKLELPSSITSIGAWCFNKIVCILLHSTMPVSIDSSSFNGVKGLFVPSTMIDMYRALSKWTDYSSRLFPLDKYKEKDEFTVAIDGYVDMGTSVNWAAFNVGATRPEEYGDYFAWGETQAKDNYSLSTYKWCNSGDSHKLTKYCPTSYPSYWDGDGEPDDKTILDFEDDAARVNWGGTWRLPTDAEWKELKNYCLWERTRYEGIIGFMVYGIGGGGMIFLPSADAVNNPDSHFIIGYSNYWSSSLYTDDPARAMQFFGVDALYVRDGARYSGRSVRPVTD